MQHVDVCMFSNGKFKNIVAEENISEPLGPDSHFHRTFELLPVRTPTKNWIAVEGALFNSSAAAATEAANCWNDHTRLAPSSPAELKSNEDRNVFAIFVSYYVKVKLSLSGMGGEVSLKLPFLLGHVDNEDVSEEHEEGALTNGLARAAVASGSVAVGASAVSQKSPQCEVISELCEMSLSNNNLSTDQRTIKDHHHPESQAEGGDREPSIKRDNGDICSGTKDPIDEVAGASDKGELNDYNRPKLKGVTGRTGKTTADEDDDDDDDEEDNLAPVISVATVQVHASNSRHSSFAADQE